MEEWGLVVRQKRELQQARRCTYEEVKVWHGFFGGCADVPESHRCTFITRPHLEASPPPVLMAILQRAAAAAVFALPRPPSLTSTSFPPC